MVKRIQLGNQRGIQSAQAIRKVETEMFLPKVGPIKLSVPFCDFVIESCFKVFFFLPCELVEFHSIQS